MLELKNISFGADSNGSYKEIIRDISLTIPDNRFVVITGPNGGGKSTLAKLIAGGTCQKSGKDYLLKDYLTDSEKYLGREVEMVSSDNRIRLEQLVVYTNWSKK